LQNYEIQNKRTTKGTKIFTKHKNSIDEVKSLWP
jgi:hypothetical protein